MKPKATALCLPFVIISAPIEKCGKDWAYGFLLRLLPVCPTATIKLPQRAKATPIATIAQDRTVEYGAGEGEANGLYPLGFGVGVTFGLYVGLGVGLLDGVGVGVGFGLNVGVGVLKVGVGVGFKPIGAK